MGKKKTENHEAWLKQVKRPELWCDHASREHEASPVYATRDMRDNRQTLPEQRCTQVFKAPHQPYGLPELCAPSPPLHPHPQQFSDLAVAQQTPHLD